MCFFKACIAIKPIEQVLHEKLLFAVDEVQPEP